VLSWRLYLSAIHYEHSLGSHCN